MGWTISFTKVTYVIYVSIINKSQLYKNVSIKVTFQEMGIPLFVFRSKFLYERHTHPELAVL